MSHQFVPPHVAQRAKTAGLVPVRFEGHPNGPFAGDGRWRGVKDFEHATLCRVFQLDPARFWFDLPSSVRGVGSNQVGWGGGRSARRISGFVFMGGKPEPVAKLTICFEAERFADYDPTSARDFENLEHA